jgi:hypothetical protein
MSIFILRIITVLYLAFCVFATYACPFPLMRPVFATYAIIAAFAVGCTLGRSK